MLNPHLMKLTQAALLRAFIAKHGPRIGQMGRHILMQSVGQQRPNDARRPLGPQNQGIPAAIQQGVHFLADHIRGFPQRAGKNPRLFEQGRQARGVAKQRNLFPKQREKG